MEETAAEEGGAPVRGRHIKKRALRNKSLTVSFDEKDLKDFVGGFHKRKKKRRREALQQQEEAARRKRIELRKKRKMERDFVIYGGAAPDSGTGGDAETDEDQEQHEDSEPVASVSGTTVYDNDDVQVMVTTSEIAREEVFTPEVGRDVSIQGYEKSKPKASVSKNKQLKKVPKKRSYMKPQSKRDGKERSRIQSTSTFDVVL